MYRWLMGCWLGWAACGPWASAQPAEIPRQDRPASPKITKDEPLYFQGDRLQYHSNDRVTIWTGHVRMTHAGNVLLCETLKAFGETPTRAERTECFGKVRWYDAIREAILVCDQAIYEKNISRLTATGGYDRGAAAGAGRLPVLTVEREKVVTTVIGETIELYSREERALAHHQVKVTRLSTVATGDEAAYDYAKEEVRMTGHPVVTQKRSVFSGEELFLDLKNEVVKMDRQVNATVYPDELSEESPPKKAP